MPILNHYSRSANEQFASGKHAAEYPGLLNAHRERAARSWTSSKTNISPFGLVIDLSVYLLGLASDLRDLRHLHAGVVDGCSSSRYLRTKVV